MYLPAIDRLWYRGVPVIVNQKQEGEQNRNDDNKANQSIVNCCPLKSDDSGNFIDNEGRKVILKGINVDGGLKLPRTPYIPTYKENSNDPNSVFFDGENVTFVGRPYPLEECFEHFSRIKTWGYNTIRYIITWEALEHLGPGKYDEEFIDYTIEVLKIIKDIGGLYVFLDMHQDVWSRFSGGSGAPLWTLYAAGLQPLRFNITQAAILHNNPRYLHEAYPPMIWTTNYMRLASLVMFTLFYSGKNYFPDLKINDINIQDYLQDHYFNSISYMWKRIYKSCPELLESGCLLGVELMNEPNCGLMGMEDLSELPSRYKGRVGTTPSVFESFKLGMGFTCEVDVYKLTISGPQKSGTEVIDPQGFLSWLTKNEASKIDSKYGWKRSKSWEMGKCLFAQNNIWSYDELIDFTDLPSLSLRKRMLIGRKKCQLLKPGFFKEFFNFKLPNIEYAPKRPYIDKEYFINSNFVDSLIKHRDTVRKITPDCFVFLQPPVLECPPILTGENSPYKIDSKTVYTPHYYDGMSLMFKTWNKRYNVDTLGIMRDRYSNPIFGMVIGEKAIRNCIKKQFIEIKEEGQRCLGKIPVLMSETGMPFDMDGKSAYVDGNYTSQTFAHDALNNALEGLQMSHTYWCYTSINSHRWGDMWNNEDFSFWSPEDTGLHITSAVTNSSRKHNFLKFLNESNNPTVVYTDGVRAERAVIRPYLMATNGNVILHEFDIKTTKLSLKIEFKKGQPAVPNIIYLPKLQFPNIHKCLIHMTSGKLIYNDSLEYLEWTMSEPIHDGIQEIIIKKIPGSNDKSLFKESSCRIT